MQPTRNLGGRRVLAYLAWLAAIAACAVAVLQLQSAVNVLGAILGASRYALRLANQVTLLVAGLAAFVYAMFLESFYRQGAERGLLFRRFAITMAIPLGIVAASLVLVEVALRGQF